jgi:hypothetical protein
MGLWSKIKKAAKKVWNAVKGAARAVVKVVTWVVGFVIGAVSSIILFWLQKKIRLHVCILHPPGGKELASVAEAEASVNRAAQIIKDKFDVKVKHYGKPYVEIIKEAAPASALGTECSASGYGAIEYGEAGSFFAKYTAGWNVFPITLVFPVTVFVVQSIKHNGADWRGCSSGLLTDYVLVTPDGLKDDTTLTHEIGHACNLFHRDDKANLMYHGASRGKSVTGWQKWWFRASRHVNYW